MASSGTLQSPPVVKEPTVLERDAVLCTQLKAEMIYEFTNSVNPVYLDALILRLQQRIEQAYVMKTSTNFKPVPSISADSTTTTHAVRA